MSYSTCTSPSISFYKDEIHVRIRAGEAWRHRRDRFYVTGLTVQPWFSLTTLPVLFSRNVSMLSTLLVDGCVYRKDHDMGPGREVDLGANPRLNRELNIRLLDRPPCLPSG